MPWWYAVAERDHDIQNPTSADKIRLLGETMRIDGQSQVLDIACGKAGPALVLARQFGCRVTGVERAPEFVSAARARIHAAGLGDRIEIVEQDATSFEPEPSRYDVAMCLGATFIWGNLDGTLNALTPAVRRGGHVAVGEVYLRRPLPDGVEGYGEFRPLAQTAARFAEAELELITFIASSLDDWDRYESLHWRAVEEWMAANRDDPDAEEFRRRNDADRRDYLAWGRDTLGWGIFVARKR
jgi:SAM-dependent methyltransferase